MAAPAISVIVPAYNAEPYIADAIDTVLEQGRPVSEVIVVDDGSSDDTAAVAESFEDPVTCLRREHAGLAATFNAGIDHARGDLIGAIDADDLWVPNKLALQLAALDEDPGLDLVFGQVEEFISPELEEQERSRLQLRPGAKPGIVKGTMLARAAVFERVGRFDPRWEVGEFIDWYGRAEESGVRSVVLPDVLLRRRLHAENSAGADADRSDYARILGEMLRRRRRPSPAE
jgi:glycosyltransferase involved in cell wall biosynthesis